MQQDSPLDGAVPLADCFSGLTHIFPSPQSGTWFVRQHKAQLVKAGVLLMLGGRWITTKGFERAVLEIGKAAAEKAVA